MADLKKLAIFISGRGSNMQSIVNACQSGEISAEVSIIISNKADAAGLDFAKNKNIPTAVINHKEFPSRMAFEDALQEALAPYDVDLICLAGFMRVLTDHFITKWPEKILNIHPSLLPKFKGLHPQKQALEANESESGCSVHYVVPELDSGPVILQKTVPIEANDTEETLSARILEQEHIAYPEAIRKILA